MAKPAVPRSTVYTGLFKKLLLTSGQGKGKGGSNCCCSFSTNYGHTVGMCLCAEGSVQASHSGK